MAATRSSNSALTGVNGTVSSARVASECLSLERAIIVLIISGNIFQEFAATALTESAQATEHELQEYACIGFKLVGIGITAQIGVNNPAATGKAHFPATGGVFDPQQGFQVFVVFQILLPAAVTGPAVVDWPAERHIQLLYAVTSIFVNVVTVTHIEQALVIWQVAELVVVLQKLVAVAIKLSIMSKTKIASQVPVRQCGKVGTACRGWAKTTYALIAWAPRIFTISKVLRLCDGDS